MGASAITRDNLKANLVIIGGGDAGLAAAVTAAENGAGNIIVLEKRGLGGNSARAWGLYAAGVDTGGWESTTYCAILSGSTLGFAINSGRIAAENAVKKFRS
jgi:glycine/D-amino acid oxidase-like deaminating enzyme